MKLNLTKRKKVVLVIAAVVVIFALTAVVIYGAFIGNGSSKGILVESGFNFNSNLLTAIEQESTAESIRISTASTSQSVVIRNYNLSTGEVNHFDITYTFNCRLSNYQPDSDVYDYYIHRGADDHEGTKITGTTVSFSGLLLPASERMDENFWVEFRLQAGENPDENPKSYVIMSAVPQTPGFMTSHMLGGSIIKNNTAFSVSGFFSEIGNDDVTENYGGFLYTVVSTGVALDGEIVTISYDASKLIFDPHNSMVSTIVAGTPTASAQINTVTFTPSDQNRYFTIAFFRADNADFWADATVADLNSLVSVRVNTL